MEGVKLKRLTRLIQRVFHKPSGPGKRITISAVVKRADGTVEDLGIISEQYLKDLPPWAADLGG